MNNRDLLSILSILVGAGALATDAAFGQYLQSLFGAHAPAILAALGAIGIIANQVLRVLANPSPPAGQVSVTAPAPPKGTTTP